MNSNNSYTQAVDTIQRYVDATEPVFAISKQQRSFDHLQSELQYALVILKSHADYDGQNPQFAA